MLEAAKSGGLRELLLFRYLELQASGWPLSFIMTSCSMLRNRMLADPSFLFKVGIEIVIDSCCATLAEVQKRGKDFWAEFELYLADLLVGVVVNVALVGMLAPYARIGQPSLSKGVFGRMRHAYAALPSSVFEAERPGCRFSVKQRIATYFSRVLCMEQLGLHVVFRSRHSEFDYDCKEESVLRICLASKWIIGLWTCCNIMRSIRKSEEDIPVPPLVKSAALWGMDDVIVVSGIVMQINNRRIMTGIYFAGVFLAVSSNTRYQIINGLERLVESSPLAKKVPPVAMAFTIGVRFGNNIYGGMQFVDWARLSGVQ
ncbi:hypothetical protein C3L33_12516, partial [Rhododendron williamsianum]